MKSFEKTDNLFFTFLVQVLLVDVFGQNASIKMCNNDYLTLLLGVLVATNILLEILFSEIFLE